MASIQNISIRNKLTVIQTIATFIAVLLCCIIFVYNDISAFKDSSKINTSSMAEIVGENCMAALVFNDKDAANKILVHFNDNPSILNAVILDKSGKEFSRYTKKGEETFSFPIPDGKSVIMEKFFEQKYIVSYQIFQENEFIGTVMLRAELTDLPTIILKYVKVAIIVLLLSIVTALVISVFFQRIIIKPLLSLAKKTKEVSETNNYSIRFPIKWTDEIGVLSEGFNNMLGQIEKTSKELRQLNEQLEQRVKERTTDLTKTQAILKQSEEKYRKIVEETGDAVYSSDYKGYLTYVNPICKKLTGYTENELVGKHFLELIAPDWKEKVAKFYKEQFDNKVQETLFSFPLITKSGEKKWIEQTVTQLKDGDWITGYNAIIRDITERKNVEDKLNESNERFSTIFENNPVGLVLADLETKKFLNVNNMFTEIFGYTKEEVIGKTTVELNIIGVDISDKIKSLVQKHGYVSDLEVLVRKKNGEKIWTLNSFQILFINNKRVGLTSFHNISERKKAEEKLKEYQYFFNSSHDLVFIANVEGYFEKINPQVIKVLGYTENELLETPFTNYIHPEDLKATFQEIEKLKTGAVSINFVNRYRKKDGSYLWFDWNSTPDPVTRKLYAVARDITDRKKAEDELKNSEHFLNSIIENIPNMLFVKDAKDLRFVRINKAGEDLLGYSKADLMGKNDYDFFPKKDADFFSTKDKEVLESGKLLEIEEEPIHTKYKGERILETKKTPIFDSNGHPRYLLGISNDITDLKKLLAELKQKSDELTNTNKELEQFVYVASHDLQEPLRTISNFVGLLEKKYSGVTDAATVQYLQFIVDAAKRMQNLIKDLLDLSRIGRNIIYTAVDCNEVFNEVIANMEASIRECSANITSAKLPVLKGNANELKQLFQNLISNAIKFRKKDVIPEINITVEDKTTEYLFAIKDNGIGIEEQSFKKLFVIFQRLNTATEYPGTGIGLATCKKIIDLHHGKLWVESKFGEGSTFYFTLPKEILT